MMMRPALAKTKRQHSIAASSRLTAKQRETLLWRTLCDRAQDAKRYIAPDCVIVNPLISPRGDHDALEGVACVSDALDVLAARSGTSPPFRAFSLGLRGESYVQTSLMSVCIMYTMRITASAPHEAAGGRRVVHAHVSSTWRQGSDGEWLLCCQHFIPDESDG